MFPHKRVKRVLRAALLCMFHALAARAQSHYNLQQLADSAAKNLPVIRQKQALINSARAVITDTRHSFLPQLKFSEQLNLGSDNSLAGTYFTYGITPSTSAGVRATNSLQAATANLGVLYGEYELVNFGLNDAKLGYAQSLVNLQEADLSKENYYLQLDLARLYFSLLRNQYRLAADEQNVSRYQRIYEVIHALTASGIKAGADSSLARAELSRSRIGYNQTAGKIAQLREQLAFLTGIAADKLVVDTLSAQYSQLPSLIAQVDSATHPLLHYYLQKQAIFKANEQLIRTQYRPKILLSAATWARGSSIQYNDQFKALSTGLGYQRFNYATGLAFTYNLFNGIYRKDKLAINRFQQEASAAEYEQQKLSLQSSERQVQQALHTLELSLAELPVQLHAAEQTYQQKLAQYKAGIISLIDLTNASFVLYRSQTDYIETLNDWRLTLLEQAAAAGNLNTFIQTLK